MLFDMLGFFYLIIIVIPDAAIAQSVERILGKDEVPSSNLGSSSRKPLFSIEKSGFLFEKAITKSW